MRLAWDYSGSDFYRPRPSYCMLSSSSGLHEYFKDEDEVMNGFRTILVLIFVAISGYTAVVIANHGMGLLPIFFQDMAAMEWPGQFNLDFMCFLVLSALWVAWRHRFSVGGLMMGLLAFFGGALFLSAYLFIESFSVKGNFNHLLLGQGRTHW